MNTIGLRQNLRVILERVQTPVFRPVDELDGQYKLPQESGLQS